jgi:hypothetical protein
MMNYRRKVLSIYKFLFPKKSTNHIETSIWIKNGRLKLADGFEGNYYLTYVILLINLYHLSCSIKLYFAVFVNLSL